MWDHNKEAKSYTLTRPIMAQGPQKSFSVEDLNRSVLNRPNIQLTESELKRQLSQDLANDPALATVFNPPQIFSDDSTVGVVVWSNAGNNNQDNNVRIFGAFDIFKAYTLFLARWWGHRDTSL